MAQRSLGQFVPVVSRRQGMMRYRSLDMVSRPMPSRPSLLGLELSDAMVLAGLSLLGTAAAFVFEMGYCTFHRIPFTLIVFSTPRIVAFAVTFAVVFIYAGLYIQSALVFLRGETQGERWFGKLCLFAALAAFAVFIAEPNLNAGHFLLAMAAAHFVMFLSVEAGDFGLSAKVDLREAAAQLIANPRRISLLVLVAITLVFMFGLRQASTFDRQYVDADNPDRALVAVYGENWIFRKTDPVAGKFLDEILVMPRDSVGDLRMVRPKAVLTEPNRLDDEGDLIFPDSSEPKGVKPDEPAASPTEPDPIPTEPKVAPTEPGGV